MCETSVSSSAPFDTNGPWETTHGKWWHAKLPGDKTCPLIAFYTSLIPINLSQQLSQMKQTRTKQMEKWLIRLSPKDIATGSSDQIRQYFQKELSVYSDREAGYPLTQSVGSSQGTERESSDRK